MFQKGFLTILLFSSLGFAQEDHCKKAEEIGTKLAAEAHLVAQPKVQEALKNLYQDQKIVEMHYNQLKIVSYNKEKTKTEMDNAIARLQGHANNDAMALKITLTPSQDQEYPPNHYVSQDRHNEERDSYLRDDITRELYLSLLEELDHSNKPSRERNSVIHSPYKTATLEKLEVDFLIHAGKCPEAKLQEFAKGFPQYILFHGAHAAHPPKELDFPSSK